MNQTEIDELRRLASVSREPRHGIGCIASDCALASAARNALPRLLAALEEARAERSEARSLLLNGIQTNGDSLAFLEHVRREHAAVVAERDALKAKLAGAEDERDAYGADIHSVLEKSVGLVAERDALRAERDKANLRERNIFASLRMALGEDLGGGGGLVEILNGIEGLQDQRDAAESLAWDALGRPGGTHDKTNVQRLCEAHGALKAKLADAEAERDRMRDVLLRNNFAPCDTQACNCGGWHERATGDGFYARFREIEEAIGDHNGKTLLAAVVEMVQERDSLEEARAERDRARQKIQAMEEQAMADEDGMSMRPLDGRLRKVEAERDALKATLAKHAESERAWCELATERGAKLAALANASTALIEGIDEFSSDCTTRYETCLEDLDNLREALAAAKVQP